MTIEDFVFSRDMNGQNPVYVLRPPAKCTLSAAAYLKDWEEKVGTTKEAMSKLRGRLEVAFTAYGHWLFIGHRSWQPDNRITRHKKLWAALSEKGVALPEGERSDEVALKSSEGVKYLGYIKCTLPSEDMLAPLLRSSWETQLLFADRAAAPMIVDNLLACGWTRKGHAPPVEVLDLICDTNAVTYLPLGWFDDRESGCAVIGRCELLAMAFPELSPPH